MISGALPERLTTISTPLSSSSSRNIPRTSRISALMFTGRAAFLAGLASFLLAHVAYVGAFLKAGVSPKWTVIAAAGAVVLAAIVLRWLLPHVEDDMKVPVLGYVVVISMMALPVSVLNRLFCKRI